MTKPFLSDINKKYTECEEEVGEPDNLIQAVRPLSENDVLSAVENKLVSKEDIQKMIFSIEERINRKYEEQTKLGEIFSPRSTTSADYYNVSDLKPIVEFVNSQSRWDEFVTATHTHTKKRVTWFDLGSIFYNPEYDDDYDLTNNSGLEAVHQQYFLESTSKLLKRHVLEIVIVPGIFDANIFWRLRVQALENWDAFSEETGQKKWSRMNIEWDSHDPINLGALYGGFFEQAEKSLQSTVANLTKRL